MNEGGEEKDRKNISKIIVIFSLIFGCLVIAFYWGFNSLGNRILDRRKYNERGIVVETSVAEPNGADKVMRVAGGGERPGVPIWSPDGSRIAFIALDSSYGGSLYVFDLESESIERLTEDTVDLDGFTWSPDSSQIIFLEKYLYLLDLERLTIKKLTDQVFDVDEFFWSPDGSQIVYSTSAPMQDIFTINADGSNRVTLTCCGGTEPAWSPDGSQIAYRIGMGGEAEIYVMDADGSNETQLTDNDRFDGSPVWSPDGTQIAFKSTQVDEDNVVIKQDIYVMDIDGSNVKQLTDGINTYESHAWSPDGIHIVYQSGEFDDAAIYTVNVDSLEIEPVITGFGHVSAFSLSPDGSRIAFISNFNSLFITDLTE